MTPGITEETGQTVRTLFDTLKQSPGTLALVIFNVLFLGFVWWSTIEERKWREHVVELMVRNQVELAEKLYQCIPFDQIKNFCPTPQK